MLLSCKQLNIFEARVGIMSDVSIPMDAKIDLGGKLS